MEVLVARTGGQIGPFNLHVLYIPPSFVGRLLCQIDGRGRGERDGRDRGGKPVTASNGQFLCLTSKSDKQLRDRL